MPDSPTAGDGIAFPPLPAAPLRLDTLFKFFSAALVVEAESDDGEWELTLALHPWSQRGWCRLRVYELADGRALVLLTDLGAANPGPPLCEASGDIATQACLSYGMDPAQSLFVEHEDRRHERQCAWPGAGSAAKSESRESFLWVRFSCLGPHLFDPERRDAQKGEIEAFLGQKLP